jgi:hypothetical protein
VTNTDTQATIVSMAQQLLRSRQPPFEKAAITKAIDDVAALLGDSTFDHSAAIAELESRLAVAIGRPTKLVDEAGHVKWYVGERRKTGQFFSRYRDYLLQYQGWNDAALEGLAESTDDILELLEAPERPGVWSRRGLVVGHVQSGKTANYAGVICKAADNGYRLIVVLAGMHNALRKQTQERLDRDFLGYDTRPVPEDQPREMLGVGLVDPHCNADYLTNQTMGGDFNRTRADTQGTGVGEHPLLLVVKKNASILKNLNRWLAERARRFPDTRQIPMLVIDDEADQASVDTGDQELVNGVLDPDYEPKRINGQIRTLLDAFDRSAYVAYTATPFANVLIHEERSADRFGADLFPRSFILNLPAPDNYVGPTTVFGSNAGRLGDEQPLPLVRDIDQDEEAWIAAPHSKDFVPLYRGEQKIPPSLEEAILAFVLACATRRVRGQSDSHNSMLVHVSRFTNVQRLVHGQVETWLTDLKRELRYKSSGEKIDRLRDLWESDFLPTTEAIMAGPRAHGLTIVAWEDLASELSAAADKIQVRLVNSEIRQPLDYENHPDGLNVIAVGGDKLSRGLTLEGLSISYFLRQSAMYDSLMQMGRWFGYRPKYVDLCRLYTTDELTIWFRHVATAAEELREQLDHMAMLGATPKDYGLKIQSHDILLVTAQNKMRHSTLVQLSFAGEVKIQTVFDVRQQTIRSNAEVVDSFLSALGSSGQDDTLGSQIWSGVAGTAVAEMLASISTPPESFDVNGRRLADYIRRQLEHHELIDWTVSVRSGTGKVMPVGPFRMKTIERATAERSRVGKPRSDRYVVGTILSPRDEAIDLNDRAFKAALDLTNRGRAERNLTPTKVPSGPQIRHIRGRGSEEHGVSGRPDRGLLLIYPLSPEPAGISSELPIYGVVVSFPASATAKPVSYRYNSVLQRLELEPI